MSIPEAEEEAAFRLAPVEPDATAPYGAHPDQVVDFYRPGGPGGRPAPLVALFHGGAWRARYDRVHLSPLAAHIAGHGLAVASVEYRRGGPGELSAGRWPESLDDVAAALDALPALALRTLGADTVDPRRLVLSGHSAGGHLALWAAARHVLPADSPWHLAAPPRVRGVVALAPIADLAAASRLHVCSDAVPQFLGDPARLPYADPAALLPTGIATTLVHGTLDPEVPPQVSASFARAAARSGEELTTTWLPATAHFALITPGTPAAATAVAELTQLAW
jgi:acetyl esterase/lipase